MHIIRNVALRVFNICIRGCRQGGVVESWEHQQVCDYEDEASESTAE